MLVFEIRKEEPKDYRTVEEIVKKAYAFADMTNGREYKIVMDLRASPNFVPRLSLVAETEDGVLVGHVLFSKAKIGTETVLALAPLSVDPKYQNKGIGKALVQEGINIAKELGYGVITVLGEWRYYSRFGFVKAQKHGITIPKKGSEESLFVMEIKVGNLEKVKGVIDYDNALK